MSYGNYPDLSVVKRILVVKMRHHGDVLLTSPVFSNLQREISGATIDALVYRDTLPMLEGHPAIQRYHLYERAWKKLSFFGKLFQEIKLLLQIRRAKYDLVINLTEGDRGAIVALVSGAKIRVGIDPEGGGFKGKRKIYSHIVKGCKTPRHTVEKQLDSLRRIGIFPESQDRDLYLHVPEEALNAMKNRVGEGEFVLIHPASRWRFKCLPTATIAAVIRALHERGMRVVLTSGPDAVEKEMIAQILAECPGCDVINLAGQTSLKELAALVQLSKLLLCVDSVPLHMASALKAPVIVLFGPSSEKNWGPWMHPEGYVLAQPLPCRPCNLDGCGGSKKSDCLTTLSADKIVAAMDQMVKSSPKYEARASLLLRSLSTEPDMSTLPS